MGCKACNKIFDEEEGGQINFANNIPQKEFEDQFNMFLERSECEKINEIEMNSNIPEDYLKYSNEFKSVFKIIYMK